MNYEKLTVNDGDFRTNIFAIKLIDNNITPDWCNKDNKKLKTAITNFYKRKQILNLDEALKRKKNLKKVFPRMKLKGTNRKKLIIEIKEKVSKKNWKSIDKILEKL